MGKYIDGSGLSHFMGILKGYFVPQTRTVNGHALSSNVTVTASDIGVASGAEVNQNAFSNVKVGSTTVAADSKTDTLELVAGSNVTLTPDATNDKVTIAATDTTYSDFAGTSSDTGAASHGLVPAIAAVSSPGQNRKKILAGMGWASLTVGSATESSSGISCDIGVDGEPISGAQITMPFAVNGGQSVSGGLMSATDKVKLDGVASGAQVNQNAFSSIKVGSTTVAADTTTDTLELVAGSNVTLTPDATNDKVTIASSYTDTKNTAGSTDSSSKLFLIGATSQAANPQTYSQDTAYVGTDGHLYSNSKQVVNLSDTQSLSNKQINGVALQAEGNGFTIAGGQQGHFTLTVGNSYTLGAACAKGVDTSISAGSTSTNLPTTAAVVNYIGQVAGALVYKGAVNAESALLNVALKTGWFYIVGTAGSYGGKVCEAGDMIIVNTAGTYTTSSALGEKIDVIQTNIETLSNAEIDTLWAAA